MFRRRRDAARGAGGIPIGFKLSAQHIENDIDFALAVGVDYIILDGRGGGTGAAPEIFKNNISVPTIPALARARNHLDNQGADGVALANSSLQAIGCLGMRACHTDNCPVGVATQNPTLQSRLIVEQSARQLKNFFEASVQLMQVLARACGHDHLNKFSKSDITTYNRDMAYLTGIQYGGTVPVA